MNTVKTITGFAILAIALSISWSVWGSDLSGADEQVDVNKDEAVQPPAPPTTPAPTPVPTPEQTTTPPPEPRFEPPTPIREAPTWPGGLISPQEIPTVDIPKQMERIEELGTIIKRQEGSCCCCVEDVKIALALPDKQTMEIGGREYDYTHLGHVLTTTIDLEYKSWTRDFGDCTLQWWERTDHEKSLVDGQRLNEWVDKYTHPETKPHFKKGGSRVGKKEDPCADMKNWDDRERPCPGKETVCDVDEPGFGARYPFERDKVTDKRTLDIVIRVLSAPGCPCTLTEKVIYLRQYLELKGGKMMTQTMQELQPEHFRGKPPQPWEK